MNEREILDKMGLNAWNKFEKQHVWEQSAWIGTEIFEDEDLIDVDLSAKRDGGRNDSAGVLLTPDEAEAFGLRLVAAAGIVRARQATKEANNECG